MDFSYETSQKGNTRVIFLKGTLTDKAQAVGLLEEVDALISNKAGNFIISLEESKYMNSTGLNILINILSKARKAGGEVVVCSVPEKIKELLLITKLNTVFSVTDSLDQALAKF